VSDGGPLCRICGGEHYSRGYCETHYARVIRAERKGRRLTDEELAAPRGNTRRPLTVREAQAAHERAAVAFADADSEDDVAYAEAKAAFWRSFHAVNAARAFEVQYRDRIELLSRTQRVSVDAAAAAVRDRTVERIGGRHNMKATPEIAARILALRDGGYSTRAIVREVGTGTISREQIRRIIRGIHWRDATTYKERRRRGRQPTIITPAMIEHAVLLVREGVHNPQIAKRTGIPHRKLKAILIGALADDPSERAQKRLRSFRTLTLTEREVTQEVR
jgi:hypothetical protein